MQSVIFENARILDGSSDEGEHDRFVRVADGLIEEVSEHQIEDSQAKRINLRGKTLMPGLIDCHVHVNSPSAHPAENAKLPDSLIAYHTARIVKDMLLRGFATVRDLGGADIGVQQAVEQKLIEGPRLVLGGKTFVQTGGHVDFRKAYDREDAQSDSSMRMARSSRWTMTATTTSRCGVSPARRFFVWSQERATPIRKASSATSSISRRCGRSNRANARGMRRGAGISRRGETFRRSRPRFGAM